MSDPSFYGRMGRLSAIIMILPSSMGAGWILGYFLVDRYLSTFPWGSIVGTLLGAGAGFYEILRMLIRDRETGVTDPPKSSLEFRLLWIGALLAVLGGIAAWLVFDLARGFSFLAGGALAALSLAWLRQGVNALVFHDSKSSKRRILGGFFLRLLLIPLALYAMIGLLFFSVSAAVLGFAVFHCSVFVEGILEALDSSKKHARAK